MTKDLLLEIGSDEIPARYLLSAIHDIKTRTKKALEGSRLTFDDIQSYGTPRRLAVYVTGLAAKSLDATTKVRGPSKKVAFDSGGSPTKALQGFCRSLGIDPSEAIVEKENGGEYVYGFKHEPGRSIDQILPEVLPPMVLGMDCPHPLRWGEENWRWYRPIRWVTCLFGDRVISLEIAGVKSGQASFGHRTLHPETVQIPSASQYFQVIEEAGVIVDESRRREVIIKGARELSREISGKPFEDEALLDEVTCLCENPAPFRGSFSQEYLNLPEEVLVTVMRHHQRYFPIFDGCGNVLPGFIGVRDGSPSLGMDNVRKGNEWVLKARLEDASFFYSQDLKTPLEARLPELKGVYFLRGAGTLHEKTKRLTDITAYLGRSLGFSENEMELALEAARLSKCDLVTSLVRELPELEGVMGGHYARANGATEEVAKAISQHYLPRGAGDRLPDKGVSSVVALADKLDTLSVAFSLGIEVSGSQDPMGLRRAASGVVNIILTHGYDFDIDELLRFTVGLGMQAVEKKKIDDEESVVARLKQFVLFRVEVILSERGFPIEMIRGVLAGRENRISRLPLMVEALAALPVSGALTDVVTGWRRTSVLGKTAAGRDVIPELLVDDPEKELYHLVNQLKDEMESLFQGKEYARYLDELSSLRVPIDNCLDKVLIMAKDEKLKQNRLRLLGLVSDMFTRFADFSYVLPLVGKI
jgi:glycyl-tRNA synthetase beta chain